MTIIVRPSICAMRTARTIVLPLLALLLMGASCQQVPKPATDATPPTLKWHVLDVDTGDARDLGANDAMVATRDHTLRVTLIADDPEGIADITLGGGWTTSCAGGGVANNAQGAYTSQDQPLTPDAKGNVLTEIFLLQSVSPQTDCPGGTSFLTTAVALHGTGTNYAHGTTEARLGIGVK
jgi:hypothetical protein